jgi:hypothetical protein
MTSPYDPEDPDELLRKARDEAIIEHAPDRCSTEDAVEWMREAAADIMHLIPMREAMQRYALDTVKQGERNFLRRANNIFRKMVRDRQTTFLNFDDVPNLAIVVGSQHVRLRAIVPADLEVSANDERRHAAADFTAANDACTGKERLAQRMRDEGWRGWDDVPPDTSLGD